MNTIGPQYVDRCGQLRLSTAVHPGLMAELKKQPSGTPLADISDVGCTDARKQLQDRGFVPYGSNRLVLASTPAAGWPTGDHWQVAEVEPEGRYLRSLATCAGNVVQTLTSYAPGEVRSVWITRPSLLPRSAEIRTTSSASELVRWLTPDCLKRFPGFRIEHTLPREVMKIALDGKEPSTLPSVFAEARAHRSKISSIEMLRRAPRSLGVSTFGQFYPKATTEILYSPGRTTLSLHAREERPSGTSLHSVYTTTEGGEVVSTHAFHSSAGPTPPSTK